MIFFEERGYTLAELATVLVLLAVGVSTLAPTARRLVDRAAVVSARESVVRSLTRARAIAVVSGGSEVTVRTTPPSVTLARGGSGEPSRLLGDARLRVELGGGRDSLIFRFDRLGIGRFASGTVVLRRGDAEAAVVVSSYGRVRRR